MSAEGHTHYRAVAVQLRCDAINACAGRDASQALIDAALDRALTSIRGAIAFLGRDARLFVLPEYFLTSFPVHETAEEWIAKGCLRVPGPETDRIGRFCTAAGVWVAGNSYEADAQWPGRFFQASWIVGPEGLVLKYRRLNSLYAASPHDVWTRYRERHGLREVFPVADTPIGLLIMTVRELSRSEAWMRAGQWAATGQDYPYTPGSLRDRSVGLIGYGRIGKAIGRRLEAFGVPISYFGRRRQPDVPYPFFNDLVAMAKAVDTLIAILPGGPATQNIVNAEVLAALGPRGVFLNMARGSVVDEAALKAALRNGAILAAGLDVFVNEPRVDPDLLTIPNLTVVPHVGSASLHTREKMGNLTVDNLICYKERKPPLTPVPETPFNGW